MTVPSSARVPASPSRRHVVLALASVGLQACSMQAGRPSGVKQANTPVANRASAHYGFEQFHVAADANRPQHVVRMAIPKAAPPAAGHALLLMLDGDVVFDLLTGDLLDQHAAAGAPLVIATLGYGLPRSEGAMARAHDFTPRVGGEVPSWDDSGRRFSGGGADAFLDGLSSRVLPAVFQRARCNPAHATFWGHSLGGLLVLYTLYTRPHLFARYAAADPSLWWREGAIHHVEERAVPLPAGRKTELLLMVGTGAPAAQGPQTAASAQRPGDPPQPTARQRTHRRDVVQHEAPALIERQARRAGMAARWQGFAGLNHAAVRSASLAPTLQFAQAW